MSQGFYDYNGEGQYYTDPNGFGDYQYQKISDLIETFMTVYVGENKIISKADRSDVAFFAKVLIIKEKRYPSWERAPFFVLLNKKEKPKFLSRSL